MEFALRRPEQYREPDALLLEEPEDHLTQVNLKKLMNTLVPERQMQLFVPRHSSHISSRPGHFAGRAGQWLSGISPKIQHFFYQGLDINVLEFALAQRVILVKGDVEFILTGAFFRNLRSERQKTLGCTSSLSAVHVSAATLSWRIFRATALLH